MKRTSHLYLWVLAFMSVSCTSTPGDDVMLIDVPDGYELSAGTSTLFMQSSRAYDTPADWVRGTYSEMFNEGDRLYDNQRNSGTGYLGGLGPVQAGFSCGSCHNNAGRTTPSLWTQNKQGEMGSGDYGFSSMLVYITRKNGALFRDYGRVLHDQSIIGVKAEGKLHVDWHFAQFSFHDGEPYELAWPTYRITEWYADSIRPEDMYITVRQPLRHVGMGQMMCLDANEIEALARQSNYPEWGISGRCNYITERGVRRLGLSGNKAQHADLTVELGFSSDMGVTNSRYPEEICEGQEQMRDYPSESLEVSTYDMECVDMYLQGLGVPARRNTDSPTVAHGERLFRQAGCHLCHTTTLHTKPSGTTLLNGMQLPWLGGQVIHPYSDYLLHDMGAEICGVGLDDHYVSGLAQGCEWRTTPLWGIGLQQRVNGHTYFLHDGRARNFVEAVMWHGGEAYASRQCFSAMSKSDRDALIDFLKSL